MKVKLKDVLPNPYRQIASYPIQEKKIEALKASIESTSWWGNVVVRRSPTKKGKVEIAYGHHRLATLRELYKPGDGLDFIPRKLSNDDMLRMMAHENAEEYGSSFWVVIETVRALLEAHNTNEIVDLQIEYQGGHGRFPLRELLPSFRRPPAETFVTPLAVGSYFGWVRPDSKGDLRAKHHVSTALHALRAIVKGDAQEDQFRCVGSDSAAVIIREAAAARRQHEADLKREADRIQAAEEAAAEPLATEHVRKAAAQQRRTSKAAIAETKRKLKTEPAKAAKAAATALSAGKGRQEAAKAARSVVTAGEVFDNSPPDIDDLAVRLCTKVRAILNREHDKSKLTEKLIQIAQFSEHLGAGPKRDLVGVLLGVAARASLLAQRIKDPDKKCTKPDLKTLGALR